MKRILILSMVAWCSIACGQRSVRVAEEPSVARFEAVHPPRGMVGDELVAYMQRHYWDRFDFADTVFLQRVDTSQMLDAFAQYVALYLNPSDPSPMDSLMGRASISRSMLEYFYMLSDEVLHDPNSPIRSDELYVPVLRTLLASPWFDQWERIAPEHDLRIAMQNRVGQLANDFRYTLASGATGRLHAIRAEFTLLFISNPGCAMCHDISEELLRSPMINEFIQRGDLKVLALYPDEELELWRDNLPQMSPQWINGYDAGCVVREQELYDLRAIPSLYLLDSNKKVLLKDSVSVADVESVIDHCL